MLRQQKETVIRKRKELETIERKIDNRLRQIEDAVCSELDVIRFVTYPASRRINDHSMQMAGFSKEIPIHPK